MSEIGGTVEIAGKYRIVRSLGTGAGGETFEAEDVRDGSKVALKRLVLATTSDWKKVDLFQREARVLASLQHPSIPRHRDSFVEETPSGPVSYLVHDFAPGQSLRGWVESGWRADEAEVLRIGAFLLDVLAYLHALHPPVIHRDVKPANVIRSEDGRLWLVDFGAVRDTAMTLAGSSTVVGTYGYMAPEQFRGQAVAGSDIYGVGATLLYLLGGKPPTDYPQQKLKIAFRDQVNVSAFLARWIERALEPAPEDRFADAADALAVLRGEKRGAPIEKKRDGSGKRIALLAGLLGIVVVGAAGVIGRDLYRARTMKTVNAPRIAPTKVERLPERTRTGEVVGKRRSFDGRHTQFITSIAVSPDDKIVATGSDAVIKLWDLVARKEIRSIGAHGGNVVGVRFLEDGKRLLTGGGQTLKLWEHATGKELRSLDTGQTILAMELSRDEALAFTGGADGGVRVWDLATGKQNATYPLGSELRSMAVNQAGTRLAAGGKDGSVNLFSLPDGRVVGAWKPHATAVGGVAFSPDGSSIATVGDDSRVVLTAVDSAGSTRFLFEIATSDAAWGVAFSPDGKVIVALSKDKTVSFISVAEQFRAEMDSVGAYANRGAFTSDGRQFIGTAGIGVAAWPMRGRGFHTPFPERRGAELVPEKPRDEDHRRYLEYAALAHARAGDAELTAKVNELLESNPKSPLAWIANARLTLYNGFQGRGGYDPASVARAREHLAKAESFGPKPVEWWLVKARIDIAEKDDPSAREAIREAYALSPGVESAVTIEASIDRRDGKDERAARSLAALVRTTKNKEILASAYEDLADLYGDAGDVDAAEQAYQRLLELEPTNAWAHEEYGDLLIRAGEPEKGLEEAEKARALVNYGHVRKTLASGHTELGDRALWGRKNLTQALREYNEALSLDPEDWWAYYGRAAVYRAYAYDGDSSYVAKARADLKKAIAGRKDQKHSWRQAQKALDELDTIEARAKR